MAAIVDHVIKLIIAQLSEYVPERLRSFPDGKQRYLKELEEKSSPLDLHEFIRQHRDYIINISENSSKESGRYLVDSTASIMLRIIATPKKIGSGGQNPGIQCSEDGKFVFCYEGKNSEGKDIIVKKTKELYELEYAIRKIKVLLGEADFFPANLSARPPPSYSGSESSDLISFDPPPSGTSKSRALSKPLRKSRSTIWLKPYEVNVKSINTCISTEENVNHYIKSLNSDKPDPPEDDKAYVHPITHRCKPWTIPPPLSPFEKVRHEELEAWATLPMDPKDEMDCLLPGFASMTTKDLPKPGSGWSRTVGKKDEFDHRKAAANNPR